MTPNPHREAGAQFTPGPWGVEPSQWNLWIGPMRSDGRKLESIVVSVSTDLNLKPEAKANREANARLIAAAPDLLAALEAFVDGDNGDSIDTRYENARQAVAKARGESA
jgi:hypothetical protein